MRELQETTISNDDKPTIIILISNEKGYRKLMQ